MKINVLIAGAELNPPLHRIGHRNESVGANHRLLTQYLLNMRQGVATEIKREHEHRPLIVNAHKVKRKLIGGLHQTQYLEHHHLPAIEPDTESLEVDEIVMTLRHKVIAALFAEIA